MTNKSLGCSSDHQNNSKSVLFGKYILGEQICAVKGCWRRSFINADQLTNHVNCWLDDQLVSWLTPLPISWTTCAAYQYYRVSKSVLSKDAGQCNEGRGVARNVCCCDVSRWSSLCAHMTNYSFPYLPRMLHLYIPLVRECVCWHAKDAVGSPIHSVWDCFLAWLGCLFGCFTIFGWRFWLAINFLRAGRAWWGRRGEIGGSEGGIGAWGGWRG